MSKESAGILLYRFSKARLEVLLVHPGGPFVGALSRTFDYKFDSNGPVDDLKN